MEHTSITNTLKHMFCSVPPSDLIRNMNIDHGGVLTWTWIYDADGSVFTMGIGQFWVIGHRSWNCVIWRHSCSYIYIKHHTIEKYLIEASNRRCIFLLMMSLAWLRNKQIMETWVPSGVTSLRHWWQLDQRGKWYKKNIIYLWFSHFTLTGAHQC